MATPATINLGDYTRQATKASDKQAIIEQCRAIASERNLVILVKRDWKDRWQGFAKRHNARGAGHPKDYEFMPEGRRARRIDKKVIGGRVYVANTSAGTGPVEAEEV